MGRFTTSTTQHHIIMTAAAAPKAKAAAKPKAPAAHPPYAAMIKAAIKALGDKKGSSRQAILKYICANYKVDAAKAGGRVRLALKKLVTSKAIVAAAAAGKKAKKPAKKAAKPKKAAAKPKKAAAKPKKAAASPRRLLLRSQPKKPHPRRSKFLS